MVKHIKDKDIKILAKNIVEYYNNPELNSFSKIVNLGKDIFRVPKGDKEDGALFISAPLKSKLEFDLAKEAIYGEKDFLWFVLNNSDSKIDNYYDYSKSGLQYHDSYQAMKIDLNSWEYADLSNKMTQDKIEVKIINNLKEVEKFVEIIKNNFDLITIELNKYKGLVNSFNHKGKMILVLKDGVPAGCGHIYIEDNVSIIDDIAVEKAFRGKGLANVIMKTLINESKSLNLDSSLLFATPDGFPVYEKLGFKVQKFWLELFEEENDK